MDELHSFSGWCVSSPASAAGRRLCLVSSPSRKWRGTFHGGRGLAGPGCDDHFDVEATLIRSYASVKNSRTIQTPDRKASDGYERLDRKQRSMPGDGLSDKYIS
jgi:hypothetical protein